ncbi:MAG: hypothetical protein SFX18_17730 [Pirellulales bacterium]|nr:hypothetical protein [Pirellulales bacterium]
MCALVGMAGLWGLTQVAAQTTPPKRALPPQWDQTVKSLFPEDAAKELVGSRPALGAGAAAVANIPATSGGNTPVALDPGATDWTKIIDAATLESEIKSYLTPTGEDVKTISAFKSGGYKRSRISYSMLGLMFGIIAEYAGDVRFKKDALAARELFGRVSMNLKVSTDQAFSESKNRAEDLAKILSGESLETPPGIEPKAKWNEKVANRPPLMARLKLATEERLNKFTSDAGTFGNSADQIQHEAQIVAAISAAIIREGYADADSEDYQGFANAMRQAATELSLAAKSKNYDAGRAALGIINKNCDACHGVYR